MKLIQSYIHNLKSFLSIILSIVFLINNSIYAKTTQNENVSKPIATIPHILRAAFFPNVFGGNSSSESLISFLKRRHINFELESELSKLTDLESYEINFKEDDKKLTINLIQYKESGAFEQESIILDFSEFTSQNKTLYLNNEMITLQELIDIKQMGKNSTHFERIVSAIRKSSSGNYSYKQHIIFKLLHSIIFGDSAHAFDPGEAIKWLVMAVIVVFLGIVLSEVILAVVVFAGAVYVVLEHFVPWIADWDSTGGRTADQVMAQCGRPIGLRQFAVGPSMDYEPLSLTAYLSDEHNYTFTVVGLPKNTNRISYTLESGYANPKSYFTSQNGKSDKIYYTLPLTIKNSTTSGADTLDICVELNNGAFNRYYIRKKFTLIDSNRYSSDLTLLENRKNSKPASELKLGNKIILPAVKPNPQTNAGNDKGRQEFRREEYASYSAYRVKLETSCDSLKKDYPRISKSNFYNRSASQIDESYPGIIKKTEELGVGLFDINLCYPELAS